MPNFDKLFVEAKKNPVIFKEKFLVRSDFLPFSDGDHFLITFERTNSEWVQGIALYVFGSIEIESINKTFEDRTVFWENTAPKKIPIKVWQDNTKRKQPIRLPKKGLLGIKNIWDPGTGVISSWVGGAAMIVEEIENGRRYRCNDGHPDENFDDIVFTIKKMNSL